MGTECHLVWEKKGGLGPGLNFVFTQWDLETMTSDSLRSVIWGKKCALHAVRKEQDEGRRSEMLEGGGTS